MKKNFVKYFGVASTTLLAVAPVATPALMTASNLAVVKAGVQDDINAAFKTDNSLVQLTADQWKGLTSTVVSMKPAEPTVQQPASKEYLGKLEQYAKVAKQNFVNQILNDFDTYYAQAARIALRKQPGIDFSSGDGDGYEKAAAGVWNWLSNNSDGQTPPTPVDGSPLTEHMDVVARGNGQDAGTIGFLRSGTASRVTVNDFLSKFGKVGVLPDINGVAVTADGDAEASEKNFTWNIATNVVPANDVSIDRDPVGKSQIKGELTAYLESMPLWWFVSDADDSNSNADFNSVKAGVPGIFQGGSKVFESLATGDEQPDLGNGLVTVADKGGTDESKLSYVGDNLVDLQKRTDNELLNLVPSVNNGKDRSQIDFIKNKYTVSRDGGTITASRSAKDGSKVWSTILQSVLSPQNAKYPLKDLTSTNIIKTKMLVNGKDADKNQFITKDEIQNADRISIQFIFKDNGNNEYKSPTIWLTHGNKFTVNTSGLGNITRLPGDYYQPSAGITGIYNDTGLPMDTKKFVVVPAGTDLAYYTNKDGRVNLSALAALQGGILGTNGVAVNRGWTTAFEGGKLGASEYWTDPNYFYSKFGSYSDAVDVYYIDGTVGTGESQNVVTKTRAENRTAAAAAAKAALDKQIINDATVSDTLSLTGEQIKGIVTKAVKEYLDNGKDVMVMPFNIKNNKLSEMFPNGNDFDVKKLRNKLTNTADDTHQANKFTKDGAEFNATSNPAVYEDVTVSELFSDVIGKLPLDTFKETTEKVAGSTITIPSSQLTKLVANAGRTTKVDVPSKYLPQVSFNDYSNKGATYYANGSTIDNWFNYSWKADSAAPSNNDPYYPAGGVIVTGGNSTSGSSSAAKQPVGYLAPASFAANSINADQLQARVNDNIQKYLTAKLINPNTQNDSKVNGYFKGYSSGDAAYAYIKNGAVPASDLKVDTSKVDVTKPGTYYVEVTYAPLNSIKSNTVDGGLGATNGNVAITDANGNKFEGGKLTTKPFIDYSNNDTAATVSTTTTTAGNTNSLTSFAADQIFANGAPATYKLKVQITDGSSVPESGAPVIAFTEGGQNLKIAKGGTFDQFKGLQFYAYPGAKAWDQKDDSVKVSVSGKVNTNVEGTYTLVYTVTNKAGKTSTLTRVITVGSGVEKPTEYDFNLSEAYIDYVPGYNVREYSYPGNDWTGNQVKHGTDVKVTKRAVFQNGEEWYKLGDGNWVKSQYVKAGKNPSDAVDARGVVTVNYIPGYGIAVYKEAGKPELVRVNGKAKRLPHGTAWKSFKKQKVNGITYYNVGGNQWVDGRYVDFK